MKKIILGSLFIFYFLIKVGLVEACSMPPEGLPNPGELFYSHATVFAGTVRDVEYNYDEQKIKTTFDVKVIFNGDIPRDEVVVSTALGSTLCGYDRGDIQEGDIWLVYSNDSGEEVSVYSSGSQKYSSYDEIFEVESKYFPMMVGCGIAPDGVTDLSSCYIYNSFENTTDIEPKKDMKTFITNEDVVTIKEGDSFIEENVEVTEVEIEEFSDHLNEFEDVNGSKQISIFKSFWNWLIDIF